MTVVIQALDSNEVASEETTGFEWGKCDEKITLGEFSNIVDGSTYQDVVDKYGEPGGLHEVSVAGTKIINAVWLIGAKDDDGASATLSFEDDRLTTKSQTKLKWQYDQLAPVLFLRFNGTDVLKEVIKMLTNREKLRRLGIFAWDPYRGERGICDEDFEEIAEILGKKGKEKE